MATDALNSPRPLRPARNAAGFTLIEVMIGMLLFALMAMGLLASTLMIRRAAEENVYNTMALAMAQSYMEQLRGTSYTTLKAAAASGSTVTLPLINSSGVAVTDTTGGSITNNDANWAEDIVYLDEDSNHNLFQKMTFDFKVSLTDLETVSPAPGNGSKPVVGIEAIITFESRYTFGKPRVYSGTYRTVISGVPSY